MRIYRKSGTIYVQWSQFIKDSWSIIRYRTTIVIHLTNSQLATNFIEHSETVEKDKYRTETTTFYDRFLI